MMVGATGTGTAFVFDCGTQVMEVGAVTGAANGTVPAYTMVASWNRTTGFDLSANGTVTMRVLLRRPELSTGAGTVVMSEFYVNDVLAHPYTYKTAAREALSLGALSVPAQQQGGDGGAGAGAAVGGVRAWRMTLPYQ